MKRPREARRMVPRTNAELFDNIEPEYYFENGLRKVRPYYFEYQTYAKERWIGRAILDVFLKEFRDRSAQYYQEAIESNLISINGEPCTLDQLVENGDLISHRIHRHEPPVTAEDISVVYEDDAMVVVNKPASIPVHPSGRYRFNTIVEIIRHEYGYKHLSVINRLDRLTSGICILATTSEAAEQLHQQMENRTFEKRYVARVLGEFPSNAECNEPLLVVEHKLGLVSVDRERGKESRTTFERLETNGMESIVICKPFTGRTHQIRVHLKSLGFPIVNDSLYNNPIWPKDTVQPNPIQLKTIADVLMNEAIEQEGIVSKGLLDRNSEGMLCPECEITKADPTPEQLCMYLHSFNYSCPEWSFRIDMPDWTKLN